MLGLLADVEADHTYDTSKVEAFLVPAGVKSTLSTTLPYLLNASSVTFKIFILLLIPPVMISFPSAVFQPVYRRREVTRKLAEEFGLTYVDLQEAFDEAQKKFPAQRWTGDGVHPTAAGHEVIAVAWKKAAGV